MPRYCNSRSSQYREGATCVNPSQNQVSSTHTLPTWQKETKRQEKRQQDQTLKVHAAPSFARQQCRKYARSVSTPTPQGQPPKSRWFSETLHGNLFSRLLAGVRACVVDRFLPCLAREHSSMGGLKGSWGVGIPAFRSADLLELRRTGKRSAIAKGKTNDCWLPEPRR